jgi:hypothetical protein
MKNIFMAVNNIKEESLEWSLPDFEFSAAEEARIIIFSSIGQPSIAGIASTLFCYLAPLISLIISIRNAMHNAKRLAKQETFLVGFESFKIIKKILILAICLSMIFLIMMLFFAYIILGIDHRYFIIIMNDFILDALGIFLLLTAIMSLASGIVYLFFLRKNVNFLKLSFCLIFIIPAVFLFIRTFLCKHICNLNKYLSQESAVKQ